MIEQLQKNRNSNSDGNLPIGVFDSGLGGLTVVKQIFSYIPQESVIYFGDTARLPYGTKSVQTVQTFSLQIAHFLQKQGVKLIVVACNTASSAALEMLKKNIDIPVIGVIEPGARAAIRSSKNKRIGIIGTTATISSGMYERELHKFDSDAKVYSVACPLFVPLVEEGWIDSKVTEMVAEEYLKPILNEKIDTLVLGCTHYPLLKGVFEKIIDSNVEIVDSSIETAKVVKSVLYKKGLLAQAGRKPLYKFYVSDYPQKFEEVAKRFLGHPLPDVECVSLDIS
jgi:glutamate racemase